MYRNSNLSIDVIGRLGADPKLISKPDAALAVVALSLCVTEIVRNEEKNVWIAVRLFGNNAERAKKLLKRGDLVYARGNPSIYTYEAKDGSGTKSTFQVAASEFNLLAGTAKKDAQPQKPAQPSPKKNYADDFAAEAEGFDELP